MFVCLVVVVPLCTVTDRFKLALCILLQSYVIMVIPSMCCFVSTRLTHVPHLFTSSFQNFTALIGLIGGCSLGTAVFLVLPSVLEFRVAFFTRCPHIIVFHPNWKHAFLAFFLLLSPPGRYLLFDWCFIVGFGSLAFGSAYSLDVSDAHFCWLLFPFFSVLSFDPRYPWYFLFWFRLLEVSLFPICLWFFPFWNISSFVPRHSCS